MVLALLIATGITGLLPVNPDHRTLVRPAVQQSQEAKVSQGTGSPVNGGTYVPIIAPDDPTFLPSSSPSQWKPHLAGQPLRVKVSWSYLGNPSAAYRVILTAVRRPKPMPPEPDLGGRDDPSKPGCDRERQPPRKSVPIDWSETEVTNGVIKSGGAHPLRIAPADALSRKVTFVLHTRPLFAGPGFDVELRVTVVPLNDPYTQPGEASATISLY